MDDEHSPPELLPHPAHRADGNNEMALRRSALPTVRVYDEQGRLMFWQEINPEDLRSALTPGKGLTVTFKVTLS